MQKSDLVAALFLFYEEIPHAWAHVEEYIFLLYMVILMQGEKKGQGKRNVQDLIKHCRPCIKSGDLSVAVWKSQSSSLEEDCSGIGD